MLLSGLYLMDRHAIGEAPRLLTGCDYHLQVRPLSYPCIPPFKYIMYIFEVFKIKLN